MSNNQETQPNNVNPAKQVLTPETTGLTQYQLSVLNGMMKKARRAFKERRFSECEDLCRQCIDLYPSFAAAYAVLGNIALEWQEFDLAIEFYEKSLSIIPDVPLRLLNYGTALFECKRNEDALIAIEKCLEFIPGLVAAHCNRAALLVVLGRMSEGILIYENLMEKLPLNGKSFHNISALVTFEKGGKYSKVFEKLAQDIEKMETVSDLIDAHFALGTYHEALGEYKIGFKHFLKANKLISEKSDYNIEKDIRNLESNKIKYPKNGLWQKNNTNGSLVDRPIFIVGMPRSGTTLTEQILASHSKVFGAGELTVLPKSRGKFEVLTGDGSEIRPSNDIDIVQFENNVRDASKELVKAFASLSSNSRHVIDKMPQNFVNLGYKHLLLPNSKIIHCKRNPIDTCLSNFRLLYDGKLGFTSDLENLGKYYIAYSRLMDHWTDVFPNQILEVKYEDVVDDLEFQARRMIKWIGLDWEEACLDFHKSKRSINTASVAQVRQPIYKTSIGRYERYGKLLKPLIDELKPVLP